MELLKRCGTHYKLHKHIAGGRKGKGEEEGASPLVCIPGKLILLSSFLRSKEEQHHSLISLCSFALLYKRIAAVEKLSYLLVCTRRRCEIVFLVICLQLLVTKLFRFSWVGPLESHHSFPTFGGRKRKPQEVVDVIIPYAAAPL